MQGGGVLWRRPAEGRVLRGGVIKLTIRGVSFTVHYGNRSTDLRGTAKEEEKEGLTVAAVTASDDARQKA